MRPFRITMIIALYVLGMFVITFSAQESAETKEEEKDATVYIVAKYEKGDLVNVYTDDMKIVKSTDSGNTWTEYNLHTSGYVIEMFPENPDRVLFSKVDGVYLTEDGFETENIVIDVKGRHPSDIAIAPSNSSIVYAIDIGYDVYKSVDGGRAFTKLANLRVDVFNAIE